MNPPQACDTLFISERRRAMSRRTIWVMIREIAKVAGLEHLAIHPHYVDKKSKVTSGLGAAFSDKIVEMEPTQERSI
jgi:hypothetical protein